MNENSRRGADIPLPLQYLIVNLFHHYQLLLNSYESEDSDSVIAS